MNSWKNRKAYLKKQARSLKKSFNNTGGGPPHPQLDPESERILSALDDDDVELETNFDSESAEQVPEIQNQEVAFEMEIESFDW